MEQVILHFLNKGYGDLTEYRDDEYPNSVFYIKGKKVYMEWDKEDDILLVNYGTIWKDLENWFSLYDKDIKLIITKWVGQTYNMRGIIPQNIDYVSSSWWSDITI